MIGAWVDTDFGFDDLWALLLLRHLNFKVAGVSLVAGNVPLPQAAANAAAAKLAYELDWDVWQGADRPLKREPETAERILGPTGMRSRGMTLKAGACDTPPPGALEAMAAWLRADTTQPHEILALGPLTNIANLLQTFPDLSRRISRLVWMGGSSAKGNHTSWAEFNAVADAEAVSRVLESGIPFDIVDLMFCRTVTFGPEDLPSSDQLTSDLLGGYLDIALKRGRPKMAIYDPVAALALARPNAVRFQKCSVLVETGAGERYGATTMVPEVNATSRISVEAKGNLALTCIAALERDAVNGTG